MAGTITAHADTDGERLDVFVARAADVTRSRAQKLIDEGSVTVAETNRKANYRLRLGESVAITLPDAKSVAIVAENIPLDVLYEDGDIIVVNKARGMTVHPAAGIFTGTLVNALLWHCQDLSGINGELRPGIVHRLDKDTSGVMVAAKNDAAHINLAAQIQAKTARRTYDAIVCGNIAEETGVIKGNIGRHPVERKKMAVVATGKPAVTHFAVRERFGGHTLVECRLETGRTHQIRVHFSYIGHPLVGDPKYGKKKSPFASFINGQALHSRELALLHPATGEALCFTAPLPHDMQNILSALKEIK